MIDDQMERIVNALERLVELAEIGKAEPESIKEFYMATSKPLDYCVEKAENVNPEHTPKTIREKTMEVYQALGDGNKQIHELLKRMGAIDGEGQVNLKSLDESKYVNYCHELNALVP